MKRFKLIVFFLVTIITLITVIGCFRHPSNKMEEEEMKRLKIKVPAKPPKGVEIKGFE